jgi:ATP sulfurylase
MMAETHNFPILSLGSNRFIFGRQHADDGAFNRSPAAPVFFCLG